MRVAALVVGLAFAGCGELACHDVGCDSGVGIDTTDLAYAGPAVRAVRLCVESDCTVVRRRAFSGPAGPRLDHGREKPARVLVTAELLDREDRPLQRSELEVELSAFHPNGEECGPTCIVGALRLDREGELQPDGEPAATGFAVLHEGRVLPPGARFAFGPTGETLIVDTAPGTRGVTATMRGERFDAARLEGARYIVDVPFSQGRLTIDAGRERATFRVRSANRW